jgi:hypothetical protein
MDYKTGLAEVLELCNLEPKVALRRARELQGQIENNHLKRYLQMRINQIITELGRPLKMNLPSQSTKWHWPIGEHIIPPFNQPVETAQSV